MSNLKFDIKGRGKMKTWSIDLNFKYNVGKKKNQLSYFIDG